MLQELTLSESLHFLVPGLTNISALADLRQLSLTKVTLYFICKPEYLLPHMWLLVISYSPVHACMWNSGLC